MYCFNLHTNNGSGVPLLSVFKDIVKSDVELDVDRILGFHTTDQDEQTDLIAYCTEIGANLLYQSTYGLTQSEYLTYYQFNTTQETMVAKLRMA